MKMDDLIPKIIEQAPTIGVLLFIVWKQQATVDKLINQCLGRLGKPCVDKEEEDV